MNQMGLWSADRESFDLDQNLLIQIGTSECESLDLDHNYGASLRII